MDPSLPDSIGRYRVLGTLGQGAMGVVYLAHDERLDREVALKVLPERLGADPEARQRLLAEARAAARLDHPHICTVYEVGETESGRPFLALARYEGETLRQRLERGPLAPEEAAQLGRQIASGLAAAHAQGIVHRDLKPSNVFLRQGDRLRAMILDFGIAKVEGVDLTRTGMTSGTLLYAAPEQAQGRADARSDQWSLGVLLYEALAGRRPFEGSYEAATLYAILHEPPAPLPDSVPQPLAQVVMRLLSKAPEARFASAREVEAALGAEPSATRPQASGDGRAAASARQRRWIVGGIAGALVLAAAAVLPSVLGADAPEASGVAAHRLAILPFATPDAAEPDAALADGLVASIAGDLADAAPEASRLLVIPTSEVRDLEVTRTADASRLLDATVVLRGTFRRLDDSLTVSLELIDVETSRLLGSETVGASGGTPGALVTGAVAMVAETLGLGGAAAAGLAARASASPEAYEPYLQGVGYLERPITRESIGAATALFEQAIEADPDYPFAHEGLGRAHLRRYLLDRDTTDLATAEAAAREALRLAGDDAPEAAALARVTLASGAIERGRYAEAVREAQQAVALSPRMDAARRTLGRAFEADGRAADAERELKAAVDLRPRAWTTYNTLGTFFIRQGRYEEALEAYENVIRLTPDFAGGYFNLAAALIELGRAPEAVAHLETSIDLGPTPEALGNLAIIRYDEGDFAGAVSLYRQSLELDSSDPWAWDGLYSALSEIPGREAATQAALEQAVIAAEAEFEANPNDADLLSRTAVSYVTLGRANDAREAINLAVDLARDNVYVLSDAACVYAELGEPSAAARWLRRALDAGLTPEAVEGDPCLASVGR